MNQPNIQNGENMNSSTRARKILMVINIGLGANILLAASKTIAGIAGNSSALLADGINSAADVVYYIFARIFTGMAQKPADEEHPYGHHQLESVSTVVVGAFIITTAIALLWGTIEKLTDIYKNGYSGEGANGIVLIIALISVGMKIFLSKMSFKIGKDLKNSTVTAIAYDHRNDILSSGIAALGIAAGEAGVFWMDPLAGGIVALVILKSGITILNNSAMELMTNKPEALVYRQIYDTVLSINGVKTIESIKCVNYGPNMIINIIIGVEGNISVAEGDEIADNIEGKLSEENSFIREVNVHYHPYKK